MITTLRSGLLLEHWGLLLPWGATEEQLRQIAPPDEVIETPAWRELYWHTVTILGGLKAYTLEVNLAPSDAFHTAWAWLEKGVDSEAAEAEYRKAVNHLQRVLGKPLDDPYPQGVDTLVYDRIVMWEAGSIAVGLHLGLGPEFAPYSYKCMVSVGPK